MQIYSVAYPIPVLLLKKLSHLHIEAFSQVGENGWSEKSLSTTVNSKYTYTIVCEAKSKIVGFAVFTMIKNEAELLTITVSPCSQKKGVGAKLLSAGIALARQQRVEMMFLEVRADNITAIRLYHKENFQQIGLRKSYYRLANEEYVDALTMKSVL